MFRQLIAGAWLAIATIIAGCQAQPVKDTSAEQNAQGFVQVNGKQFEINGEPYRFAGANYWYGAYIAATDPDRLRKELDHLAANHVTNLRVLAVSEQSELVRAVRPAMLNKNGQLDHTLLAGLDLFLAEAAKRDIKVVLYFSNFWQWSGGMTQYLNWFVGTPLIDPDLTGKWNDYMEQSADFYTCAPCQAHYQKTIRQIIERKNTINGRAYHNDNTIMSWQLANEPRPGGSPFSQTRSDNYITWVDQTARFIKTLAPKQLVSTGSEGVMGSQEDEPTYIKAHQSPAIDYLTVHMWIKNWGWFDIYNPEKTFPSAKQKAKSYLENHIRIAKTLNKPLVLEEFGAERDNGKIAPNTSTSYRDQYYAFVFNIIEQNLTPLAGSNFWAYGGFGKAGKTPELWQVGDDYLGDPPQEPQGLNSVFAGDKSTWKIIRKHANAITQ